MSKKIADKKWKKLTSKQKKMVSVARTKKKREQSKVERKDSPIQRMDDACYSPDPLTQFLKRKAYLPTYYADLEGSARLERRIAEEQS